MAVFVVFFGWRLSARVWEAVCLIVIAVNEKSSTRVEDKLHCSLSTWVVFYVVWHPISATRTKRAHPALKLWLVTCFSYALHPKSGCTLAFLRAVKYKKEKKKWGSSPTHQTRATCQKAATLALARIHHFHTTLTRTPPGQGMPASAGKYTVSLSLSGRQIHSQADTLTSAKTPDPHHLSFISWKASHSNKVSHQVYN